MNKKFWVVSLLALLIFTMAGCNNLQDLFEGNLFEPFDPTRHNSYVSFKVDGELHVFHDQYDGVDHDMSSIVTYNNNFTIDVYNYNTDERFILDFIWEGENAGTWSNALWRPNGDWDSAFEYPEADFIGEFKTYDLKNGLVQGSFSGHIANENGESVNITEGFFYVKHEFNLPEVIIDNPTEGSTVSGDVVVSGTTTDDSKIIDVNVSLFENFGEYPEAVIDREDAEGTNNWSYTFDSTQYPNGEYIIEVFARDEHYNYSRVKSINIHIMN